MGLEESYERFVALLAELEDLPPESGAYLFEGEGMILMEEGRICWAVGKDAQRTLTMLLQERCHDLDEEELQELFQECKDKGRPLGETLVARGLVSSEDFRAFLLEHTSEAIYRLALAAENGRGRWVAHRKKRYDATFTFDPLEILFDVGLRYLPEEVEEGQATLRWYLAEEATGLAFLWSDGPNSLLPIAALGRGHLDMREVMRIAEWAPLMLSGAGAVDLGMISWADRSGLVAWRRGRLLFVAGCPTASCLAWIAGRHRRADQAIAAAR